MPSKSKDISNDSDIANAVKSVADALGSLNVLINNAGIYKSHEALAETTRANLNDHFNVNVSSAIMMAQAFRELLKKGKDSAKKPSVIVNMSSEMGSITNASTKSFAYRTSKTALNMATKCIGNELIGEGIYCISMHPGWVLTDMGGPNALMKPTESVSGILNVTANVTEDMNGKFIDYAGKFRQY